MRPSGIVTLLTDFGLDDAYVAVMQGVILRRFPQAHIVHLTHAVPPQDVARGAWVLAEAVPWFPAGTVHVAVVDPGVGTGRGAIVAQRGDQWIVAPDNGLVGDVALPDRGCWALTHPDLALPTRSATFHGRDLFAPAGALLASGALRPWDCGPPMAPLPAPRAHTSCVRAVDHFGNLITSLHATALPPACRVAVAGTPIPRFVRTYGDASPGDLVALIGSSGRLEVSVVQGSAAALLAVGVGAPVTVWGDDDATGS